MLCNRLAYSVTREDRLAQLNRRGEKVTERLGVESEMAVGLTAQLADKQDLELNGLVLVGAYERAPAPMVRPLGWVAEPLV